MSNIAWNLVDSSTPKKKHTTWAIKAYLSTLDKPLGDTAELWSLVYSARYLRLCATQVTLQVSALQETHKKRNKALWAGSGYSHGTPRVWVYFICTMTCVASPVSASFQYVMFFRSSCFDRERLTAVQTRMCTCVLRVQIRPSISKNIIPVP